MLLIPAHQRSRRTHPAARPVASRKDAFAQRHRLQRARDSFRECGAREVGREALHHALPLGPGHTGPRILPARQSARSGRFSSAGPHRGSHPSPRNGSALPRPLDRGRRTAVRLPLRRQIPGARSGANEASNGLRFLQRLLVSAPEAHSDRPRSLFSLPDYRPRLNPPSSPIHEGSRLVTIVRAVSDSDVPRRPSPIIAPRQI